MEAPGSGEAAPLTGQGPQRRCQPARRSTPASGHSTMTGATRPPERRCRPPRTPVRYPRADGLDDPGGWRWQILGELGGLAEAVDADYEKAREKQRAQALAYRVGAPLATAASRPSARSSRRSAPQC